MLRVHWAGKQTLGVAASAYSFMRVWNQPESRRLEYVLLERLASAPWRLTTNRPPTAVPPVQPLQVMLRDVDFEECCLEIRRAGDGKEAAFAIRLNKQNAAEWNHELANAISSLEGNYPSHRPGGWSLLGQSSGKLYEVERTGTWLVFGVANSTNALFREITARIEREQVPFTITTNSHWLAVDADSRWVVEQLGLTPDPGADLPRVSLQMNGDGAYAVATGELVFAQPLGLNLEPWAFPKGQVQGPVIGFSAVRGVEGSLAGTRMWNDLKLGAAPNQIFTWADARAPLQMHIAAPTDHANAIVKTLNETFLPRANKWLAGHGIGSVGTGPDAGGIMWKDLPMIAPYLRATTENNQSLLEGGLVPNPKSGMDAPAPVYPRLTLDEMLATLDRQTNLVAYEWETTGERAESFHLLGQILRASTRHPQIPAGTPTSTSLQTVRPRLGNTTTVVTLAAPNKLAFKRKSTTGFNALELHVLADWMESPEFPRGFYSTLSPVGPVPTPNTKP